MKTAILLIGAGGHCRACIDVVETSGLYEIAGIITATGQGNSVVMGYPSLGTDQDLPLLLAKNNHALIAVGQIKESFTRRRLFDFAKKSGAVLPAIRSNTAYVSKYSQLGEGTIVMHGCLVNSNAQIGKNCILNTQSLIEHDTIIGDHCHVSTGAKINGGVVVGSNSFIGSGAIIFEGVEIPGDRLSQPVLS